MVDKKWLALLLSAAGLFLGVGLIALAVTRGAPSYTAHAASAPPPGYAQEISMRPDMLVTRAVPGQFIAKVYTEALGRLPTQEEWQTLVTNFTNSPDCAHTVTETLLAFYTGPEFTSRDYDLPARLLALYRGALNREPDLVGLGYFFEFYQQQLDWLALVAHFVSAYPTTTMELRSLAVNICDLGNPPHYGEAPYGWGVAQVSPLTVTGPYTTNPWVFCGAFCGQTQDNLQQLLYSATITATNPSHTVYLAQKAVVPIAYTLTIPIRVTLTTWFTDSMPITPSHYAKMGRLVRNAGSPDFIGPVIQLRTGSTLSGIWVDGQKARWGANPIDFDDLGRVTNIDIIDGGNPAGFTSTVINSRLSDPWGWTNLRVVERFAGTPCGNVYIAHNLISGYANKHYAPSGQAGQWADGLSLACAHTTAKYNQIVDASDVGIVVFRAGLDVSQASTIRHNIVLNAGNSAYAALGANGLRISNGWPPTGTIFPFDGTLFANNLFWTAPTAHLDIAVALGTKAWFGENSNLGQGAAFISNTTGSQTIRTNIPIAVSGMLSATICANTLDSAIVQTCYCPTPPHPAEKPILVSESPGWGSLVTNTTCPILPLYDDITVTSCISHVPFPVAFLPVLYKSGGQEELGLPTWTRDYPPPMSPERPALPPQEGYPQP